MASSDEPRRLRSHSAAGAKTTAAEAKGASESDVELPDVAASVDVAALEAAAAEGDPQG